MKHRVKTGTINPVSGQLSIQTFHGISGLNEIADDWNTITDSMQEKECFQLIDWYRCYLDSLANEPGNAIFFIVYKNEKPLAIFPFVRFTQNFGFIKNHILGLPKHHHVPFGDFVIAEDADLPSCIAILLDELRQQPDLKWDTIFLPRVIEHSSTARIWNSTAPSEMKMISHPSEPCDYLPLKPYDELFQELSSKMRSNLRRARKRAQELENFQYHNVTTFPDLEKAFDEFLDLEASGWKGEQERGTAIKLDQQLVSFYRLLLERFSPHGRCAIHILRDGDRPICASFGLITNETFYGLKMAYDEEFKGMSPGSLLQEQIIKKYTEEGTVKSLNLISHVSWQRPWQPLQYKTFELTFFKRTIRGKILFVLHKMRNCLRILKIKWRKKFFVNERGKLRFRAFW
jgi:Acetyltransferase (GNAT) domain